MIRQFFFSSRRGDARRSYRSEADFFLILAASSERSFRTILYTTAAILEILHNLEPIFHIGVESD